MVIKTSRGILDAAVSAAQTSGSRDNNATGLSDRNARPSGLSAPGILLNSMAVQRQLDEANKTIEGLQAAGNPRLIDPALVRRSRFADRDEGLITQGPDWAEFSRQIKVAGGNTVAIEVLDMGDHFETIFGHRRTAACLENGLKLKANVYKEIEPKEHWLAMRRENEGGKQLSVIEKGRSFLRGIENGFFKNAAEISQVTGEHAANISLAMKAGKIPSDILSAIGDWREVTWAQARTLVTLNAKDSEALLNRAVSVPASTQGVGQRVDYLANNLPAAVDKTEIKHGGIAMAQIVRKKNGCCVVTLNWSLSSEDEEELVKLIDDYTSRRSTIGIKDGT